MHLQPFLTAAEVAATCQVTLGAVYTWIDDKTIDAEKFAGRWFIPRSEVKKVRTPSKRGRPRSGKVTQ